MKAMVNTPEELYDAILAYKPDSRSTVCLLHKPCKERPMCGTTSTVEVLDFDAVEKELAKGRRSRFPSCDGVTLNPAHSFFCFVEIKGWKEFVERNIDDPEDLSEDDKQMIIEKAEKYNLEGKLKSSMDDCEEIAGDRDLFLRIPFVYVIVTDISTDMDAAKDIAANLSILAETASVWTFCDENMRRQMGSIDDKVQKVYTHCRDFDTCIREIN